MLWGKYCEAAEDTTILEGAGCKTSKKEEKGKGSSSKCMLMMRNGRCFPLSTGDTVTYDDAE